MRVRAMHGLVALLVFLVAFAAGSSWLLFTGPRLEIEREPRASFPDRGFDHTAFGDLLARFVDGEGRVDYAAWSGSADARAALERYLAACARWSPDSAPERFPSRDHRLAYWINAYNACVIHAVLVHWPIGSVHDVRAPIELRPGFGFFWRLRFELGGSTWNLFDVERDAILGRFDEPRVHFVLVCASRGCPDLRREAMDPARLEAQLTDATRRFLADPSNLAVDPATGTVTLSALLDWYRGDFGGRDAALLAWVAAHAPEDRAAAIRRIADPVVSFAPYDWSLNGP